MVAIKKWSWYHRKALSECLHSSAVERPAVNRQVISSNLIGGATLCMCLHSSAVERPAVNRQVISSNLIGGASMIHKHLIFPLYKGF